MSNSEDGINQPAVLPQTRAKRLIALFAVGVMFAVIFFLMRRWSLPDSEATIISSFGADFRTESPKQGWRYCWNRNSPVGDTNGYVDLVWNGDLYAAANRPLPAAPPARYLRLSNDSGHPGQGPSQTAWDDTNEERAVIIGFTVPEAGRYSITRSFIARHQGGRNGSIHLQVWVNGRNTATEIYCRSREHITFDR